MTGDYPAQTLRWRVTRDETSGEVTLPCHAASSELSISEKQSTLVSLLLGQKDQQRVSCLEEVFAD